MDFRIHFKLSDKLPEMAEISVILRGESFDKRQISQINTPVFLVNPTEKIERENAPI